MNRVIALMLTGGAIAIAQAPAVPPAPVPPPRPATVTASQAPTRDGAARPTVPATAAIRGHVVAVETGRGIRGVTVRASAPGVPARSAITDADGKYELKDLPPGRYVLGASKLTFISIEYGQARPFETGKPLALSERETLENIDFHLPLGGIVAGKVVDELGEPVVNFTVRPLRMRYVQGRRELAPATSVVGAAQTDDLGEFRIFGLSPGQYYVSVSQRLALDADSGGSTFATTYYPGVPTLNEARRLNVEQGKTVSGVDFMLTPVRTATITGRGVDADGRPLSRGTLNMSLRPPAPGEGIGGAPIRADGTFTLSNIPPGDYNLDLDSSGSSPGASIAPASRASLRVVVAGEDINGIVLGLTRLSGAVGRLVLPAGVTLANPASVRLTTVAVDPNDARYANGAIGASNDLTFDLPAPPGQLAIRVAALPAGWALKEVRQGGRIMTDVGTLFVAGEKVRDIEVELTNRAPVVSGVVRNARGETVTDYAVVVFSQSADRRNGNANYFALARPDQSGAFRVSTLAPGDYCAVALEYVDPSEAGDPEILSRLEGGAVRFSIGEGETRTLELTFSDQ